MKNEIWTSSLCVGYISIAPKIANKERKLRKKESVGIHQFIALINIQIQYIIVIICQIRQSNSKNI